jgi:hypothetical protein
VRNRLQNGQVEPLRFADHGAIDALLHKTVGDRSYEIVERYELGGGILADRDKILTVYGFGESKLDDRLLGLDRLEQGVGYTLRGSPGAASVQVPVVSVEEGGYSSGKVAPINLRLSPVLDPGRVAFLFGSRNFNPVIVDFPTFQSIATLMFGGEWESVVARYTSGELSLTPLVGAEYVQVDDLGAVDKAAGALEAGGYNTVYALRAFDDLSSSLRETVVLGLVLILATVAGTVAFLAMNWNTYFTLSRRDIGMLKHFGYADGAIRRIYARRMSEACVVAVTIVAAFVAAGSVALLGGTELHWAALNVLALVVVVAFVRWWLVRVVLTRHIETDVLTLLKQDRQFQ